MRMRALVPAVLVALACVAVTSMPCACAGDGAPPPVEKAADPDATVDVAWSTLRARPPRLLREGPAPGARTPPALPAARDVVFERVLVPSGDLRLTAVLARPLTGPRTSDTPIAKLPGVVLLHGGFMLASDQLQWARTVALAGYVALMPALRGENGNPGSFGLLRGEVEDARAAVRFLAQEPDVDVDALYVIGHSVGGGLAGLLAVEGDVPVRLLASVNGVYAPSTFARWQQEDPKRVPFDVADAAETQVRSLVPFAHQLQLPLVLYVARGDEWAMRHAKVAHERARAAPRPLELVEIEGDHLSAFSPALTLFLARIARDVGPGTAQPARPTAGRASPAAASARAR